MILLRKETRHIDLLDYKFGFGFVDDASENIQGQAYALGGIQLFDWAETITVHFILPRRNEISVHTFTIAELETVKERLRLILDRATAEEPVLSPHTESCRFCRHRITCPALADKLLPLAKKYAEGHKDFELALFQDYDPALVDDPATLGKMKNVAAVLDRWITAANRRALEVALETGETIPGYQLLHRSPVRKIKDVNEAFEAVSDIVDDVEFREACKVSLPDLAKAYAAKLQRGEKKSARAAVELRLVKSGVIPADDGEGSPYLRKSQGL